MDAPIWRKLTDYVKSGVVPLHMPGHKRNTELAGYLGALGAGLDITEIYGFDDLNSPEGIFAQSEKAASGLWGSERAFYSVNGSTGAILASVRAAARKGSLAIVARNSHLSVYHALELCSLNAVYVSPRVCVGTGICADITPESVKRAIDENTDVSLVIITSPTYEGVISDISGICDVAHSAGIPVMVDEAHGAHLGIDGVFPGGAVSCGADIVVQSLHKTLPALTQTAIVHVNGNLVDSEKISRELAVFQTSSPSYLLSASIDGCVRLMIEKGEYLLREWMRRLDKAYDALSQLNTLKCLDSYVYDIFDKDPGKIVILTAEVEVDGPSLAHLLRRKYSIEIEMASRNYIIAMTGLGDTNENLEVFVRALIEIDKLTGSGKLLSKLEDDGSLWNREHYSSREGGMPLNGEQQLPKWRGLCIPKRVLSACEAAEEDGVAFPVEYACGAVCADYIFAYPPGVPLLVPGEEIDDQKIEEVNLLIDRGIPVHGIKNGFIKILKK